MDLDDDAPPDLIDTGPGTAEEARPAKVPLTIVTGVLDLGLRGLVLSF